jgi:hypothetical protein
MLVDYFVELSEPLGMGIFSISYFNFSKNILTISYKLNNLLQNNANKN